MNKEEIFVKNNNNLLKKSLKAEKKLERQMNRLYRNIFKEIERDIFEVFSKYATDNKLSYVDGTSINAITNKVRSDNTSGVKGIYWNKRQKNWVVRIGFKGKRYYVGAFKDLEDAKEARKEAEEKLYKPFLEEIKEGVDDGKK